MPPRPVLVVAACLVAGALAGSDPAIGRARRATPAAVPGSGAAAAGLTLVQDGRARAALVIAPSSSDSAPDPALRRRGAAATDDGAVAVLLQDWLERMTGARLPISTSRGGRVPIYVGRAARDAGLRLDDIASESNEGVRVRIERGRVLIAGQNPGSTFKAAATFLEHLGCRWYMEGELGREIPQVPTLRVEPVEISARPGLSMRHLWGGDGWGRDTEWKLWNGAGGIDYAFGHDWQMFDDADFAAHPEWFALDADGRRVNGPWLNTGNEALRRAFADRLLARIAPGEHASISPPDRIQPDFSPASTRLDVDGAIEPVAQRSSMSDRFLDFANAIARAVRPQRPDTLLGFYAYSDYSQPPRRIRRLEPNLCVWIAPFRYSRYHAIGDRRSPSRRRLADEIERWRRVASCLGYRTYNYNLSEAMTPFAKLSTWSHDIPYLAERGFVGISIEAFPSWDLSAPALYLALRLAYAPESDPDAILGDFYRGFYGPAAGSMRRYWQLLDEGWTTLDTESGSIYAVQRVFTAERLRRLDRALSGAERASRYDETRRRRVAMARAGFLNARDFMQVRQALGEGRLGEAIGTYRQWRRRAEAAVQAGEGAAYTVRYMDLFVGRYLDNIERALVQAGDDARIEVLPDRMEMAYEQDLLRNRRAWRTARTRTATLEQQGMPERFEVMYYRAHFNVTGAGTTLLVPTAIDGISSFSVNRRPVADATEGEDILARYAALTPHTIDITDLVRRGSNELTIRVDHDVFRRMKLGGIVGPVFILQSRGQD